MNDNHTTPVAENDNCKPRQAKLPKWLAYNGTWFPACEAEEYIEHDFYFGRPQHEYPIAGEKDLLPTGAIMEFRTLKMRIIFAAIVPDELEYDVDWETGDSGEADFVTEWHAEWYLSRSDADTALHLGLKSAIQVPNDENGTWGIDSFQVAA